ncbi:MAG: hypothetical protein IT329_22580 [Caldilineaceae bacterium]|nr:hypothetical protein [Caldilineaceae bacterium]
MSDWRSGWQQAADPTAAITGAAVAHQARLAGNEQAEPHYARLGAALGRVI